MKTFGQVIVEARKAAGLTQNVGAGTFKAAALTPTAAPTPTVTPTAAPDQLPQRGPYTGIPVELVGSV